jgi:hypothetical protein
MVYPLRTINTNHVCPKVKTISQYRSSQAKHSSSTLGVTIRTMDHVSPLMRQRMSRCTPSGSIGPGPWGNFFHQPKNEIITSKIQTLQTQISGKFNADELLQELALFEDSMTLDH